MQDIAVSFPVAQIFLADALGHPDGRGVVRIDQADHLALAEFLPGVLQRAECRFGGVTLALRGRGEGPADSNPGHPSGCMNPARPSISSSPRLVTAHMPKPRSCQWP